MPFKYYRKRAGLTQEQVAKELGVDRTTVSKWDIMIRQPLKTLLTRSSKYGRMSGGERNGKANDDVWGGHAT
jgi:transcriptional regulator with XRE-family HTH domain